MALTKANQTEFAFSTAMPKMRSTTEEKHPTTEICETHIFIISKQQFPELLRNRFTFSKWAPAPPFLGGDSNGPLRPYLIPLPLTLEVDLDFCFGEHKDIFNFYISTISTYFHSHPHLLALKGYCSKLSTADIFLPGNSLFKGTVLCILEGLAISMTSIH